MAPGAGGEPDRASDPGDLDLQPCPEDLHGSVIELVTSQSERQRVVAVAGVGGEVKKVWIGPLLA